MDAIRRETSSSSFGLFREETFYTNGRPKLGKFRISFAIVAVSLLVLTIVFFVLQVNRSTRKETLAKAKRFANYPEPPPPRKAKENVSIVQESRMHPNHRYDQHIDENRATENDWTPVVKEPKDKLDRRNNIQDIIRRIEMKEKSRKLKEENLPRKPILFKGVYMKKSEEVDDKEREYFMEINEMVEGDRKGTHKKKAYSDRASPFRLRDEDEETPENQPTRPTKVPTKKPIIVMLDIYPLIKPDARELPVAEPIANAGRTVTYTLVPLKKGQAVRMPDKSRMFVKLNLYPKELARIPPHLPVKSASDWFDEKIHGHIFQLIGHNPQGKAERGKKIDDNRGWIEPNYLASKHWDRRYGDVPPINPTNTKKIEKWMPQVENTPRLINLPRLQY